MADFLNITAEQFAVSVAESFFHIFSDGMKKRLDRRALEKHFTDIAAFLRDFEKQGQDGHFFDEIYCVFSEENIRQLAWNAADTPGFLLKNSISERLKALCEKYDIPKEKADRFTGVFIDMVFKVICQTDTEKAFQMFVSGQNDGLRELLLKQEGTLQFLVETMQKQSEAQEDNSETIPGAQDESGGRAERGSAAEGDGGTYDWDENLKNIQAEWNLEHIHIEGIFGDTKQRKAEMLDLIEHWKNEREMYPGWYILPPSYRDRLRINTGGEEFLQWEELHSLETRFVFLYEMLWRYETGLFPYSALMLENAAKIWKEMRERDLQIQEEYRWKWVETGQILLREFREALRDDRWNDTYRSVREVLDISGLSEEAEKQRARLREKLEVEQIRFCFYRMRFRDMFSLISMIHISRDSFENRMFICSLRAQCGAYENALEEICALAADVREARRRAVNNKTEYIYLSSLLPCILHLQGLLVQISGTAERIGNGVGERNGKSVLAEVRACYALRDEFREYYSLEKEIDCCAEALLAWREHNDKLPPFEPGRERVELFGSNDICREAYTFCRVLERAALSFRFSGIVLTKRIEKTLFEVLSLWYTHYAWQLMIISGDINNVKICLSWSRIAELDRKDRDVLVGYMCGAAEEHLPAAAGMLENAGKLLNRQVLLPLAEALIHLLYTECGKEQVRVISAGMQMITKDLLPDPALKEKLYYTVMRQTSDGTLFDEEEKTALNHAFGLRKNVYGRFLENPELPRREWEIACAGLGILYDMGSLSKDQSEQFGELLWSRINDATGLPDTERYYFFVYLRWPCPPEIDAGKRIKDYFLNEQRMEIVKNELNISSPLDNIYLKQLESLNREADAIWTLEEKSRFLSLLADMWNRAKEQYLVRAEHFTFEKYSFLRVCRQIEGAAADFLSLEISEKYPQIYEKIRKMIREMEECGIPVFEAKIRLHMSEQSCSQGGNCINMWDPLCEEIIDALYDTDDVRAFSACSALESMAMTAREDKRREYLMMELMKLIRAGKEPGLSSFLILAHNLFYVCVGQSKRRAYSVKTVQEEVPVYPERVMRQVEKALLSVEERTRLKKEDEKDSEIKRKLEVRSRGASLAYQVYLYEWRCFPEREHSGAVNLWKAICTGEQAEEEFGLVRRMWLEKDF